MSIKLGLQVTTKNYLVCITKTSNLPFSSNFIFRILSLLLEGHLCPQTSSQGFGQIRCFYAIFSIIKIYFVSFIFQRNQGSPSKEWSKGNWTQTKTKGQMLSQTAGFQNHTRPKFKFRFHTSSVALGKLVNKSASFVLWCSSVIKHLTCKKALSFIHSIERGKKQNKKTRKSSVNEGTGHLVW